MIHAGPLGSRATVLALPLLAALVSTLRAEPVLIGEQTSANYELSGETRLTVRGLTGTLSLIAGSSSRACSALSF